MYLVVHLICIYFIFSLPTPLRALALERRDPVPAGYVAAPYYPTSQGGWAADWTESYAKAAALVRNMTLAEKVNLTAGTGLYMGMFFIGLFISALESAHLDESRVAGETGKALAQILFFKLMVGR